MILVKIGTGSRILPPEGPFRISFWWHISAPDQDIFRKFGWYVGNELSQDVEWSKYVSFKNPIWQMVAMHHTCNISAFWECISAQIIILSRSLVGVLTEGSPNVLNGPNMILSKIQFGGRWPYITYTVQHTGSQF